MNNKYYIYNFSMNNIYSKIVFNIRYIDTDDQEALTLSKTKILTAHQQTKLEQRRLETIEQLT